MRAISRMTIAALGLGAAAALAPAPASAQFFGFGVPAFGIGFGVPAFGPAFVPPPPIWGPRPFPAFGRAYGFAGGFRHPCPSYGYAPLYRHAYFGGYRHIGFYHPFRSYGFYGRGFRHVGFVGHRFGFAHRFGFELAAPARPARGRRVDLYR